MGSMSAPLPLQPLSDYAVARTHVFPSKTSMTWFVRQHRDALIREGALLMISGRWFVHPDKFDSYVPAEGTRAARARTPNLD